MPEAERKLTTETETTPWELVTVTGAELTSSFTLVVGITARVVVAGGSGVEAGVGSALG